MNQIFLVIDSNTGYVLEAWSTLDRAERSANEDRGEIVHVESHYVDICT